MCRLYGLHANERTKVECSLVHAQNALMAQGIEDAEGLSHGHGWGLAAYRNAVPMLEKQAWAVWHGEHFKRAAARAYSTTTIAHVRRATVGPAGLINTHPFVHGQWAFAHNGTIPSFAQVRPKMLKAMSPLHRSEIRGDTDSEHIFRYLLTLWGRHPERSMMELVSRCIRDILLWVDQVAPGAKPGLNLLWGDGAHLAGSRFNRSLFYLERNGVFVCDICGHPHVHHDPKKEYLAVEVASEPITDEKWLGIPNGTVFNVDPDMRMHIESILDFPVPQLTEQRPG